jgi:ATP-dependent protease ClpP protease subunit
VRTVYPLKCQIRAESGVTRVDVYDDIGEGGFFSEGLSAKNFAAQLRGVKGPLEIHINSGGGDVFDGIAIGNALRKHKGMVTTVNDGVAASIASVILQAGQERVVEPGSMVMVHDAFGMCVGNAAEMAKMTEVLDKNSDNIATIYAERAGGTAADWRATMKDETWYTADEAVEAGLADRVGAGVAAMPDGLDLAAFTAIPGRIAAALRTLPAAAAVHAPFTGTHSHPHPAMGAQGGDATHEHAHAHDGDAIHSHSHADGEPGGAQNRLRGDAAGPCCEMCGPDCMCSTGASARGPRILGIESMPLNDKALPVHHTATTGEPWDGPAAVAAMPGDDTVLAYCHAWEDSAAAGTPHREGDDDADDQKSNYKFPHHKTKGGPANLAACRNGLDRLSSASIPAGDDAGVRAHLEAHLKDGGGHPGDHAHHDISALDVEKLANALKGALA